MANLVDRLRDTKWFYHCEVRGLIPETAGQEAADRITALEAMCETLEGALEASGYAVNAAAIEVDAELRGHELEAEKYRKIVTEFRDQRRRAITQYRAMKEKNDG